MLIIIGKVIYFKQLFSNCAPYTFNSIPIEKTKRKDGRPESIASEDSVNLEELINANYTADMDDETDLLDLADLDLIDDSADDFWQLNKVKSVTCKKDVLI